MIKVDLKSFYTLHSPLFHLQVRGRGNSPIVGLVKVDHDQSAKIKRTGFISSNVYEMTDEVGFFPRSESYFMTTVHTIYLLPIVIRDVPMRIKEAQISNALIETGYAPKNDGQDEQNPGRLVYTGSKVYWNWRSRLRSKSGMLRWFRYQKFEDEQSLSTPVS